MNSASVEAGLALLHLAVARGDLHPERREHRVLAADGLDVDVTAESLNTFSFHMPPIEAPPNPADPCAEPRLQVKVALTCAELSGPAKGHAAADSALTYETSGEPPPSIRTFSPVGLDVARDAKMLVVFTRPMNAETITAATFRLEGVEGDVSAAEDDRTFTFTPKALLEASRQYTAIVNAGLNGAKSKLGGRCLRATVAPDGEQVDPNADRWKFTTAAQ